SRMVVVVHRLKNGQLLGAGLFSQDFGAAFIDAVEIALPDLNRLAGQSAKPFDVVGRWILWELEDAHIPAVGLADLVAELRHQNSIADEDWVFSNVETVAAVRADRFLDAANEDPAFTVEFFAGPDRELEPAFGAGLVLVEAEQRRRH